MATRQSRLLMLIDDEPAQSRLVAAIASREGWRTLTVGNGEEALAMLAGTEAPEVGAILIDQWGHGDDACDLIRQLRAQRPDTPLLMLTTSTSPLLAVEAMRAGATDYLVKPVGPERLLQALASASKAQRPGAELQPLTEKLSHPVDFDTMVGSAAQFRTALAKAATAARGHSHVLIEGESGTGKDMLTRALHAASTRSRAAMHVVHCDGIPPASLESLLFGHEKGAVAGAFERHTGLLERCDGGTLILDDIDRIPVDQQERLADVLASGIVRPTGAKHGFRVDLRVVATSDFSLDELVKAGGFSRALHEQVAATRIHLPALRDRLGDIPALTRYFLAKIAEQPGMKRHSIADSALSLLEAYDWPGNVRQLENAVRQAVVLHEGDALTAQMLPAFLLGDGGLSHRHEPVRGAAAPFGARRRGGEIEPLWAQEKRIIEDALDAFDGNIAKAAAALEISPSTIYRKRQSWSDRIEGGDSGLFTGFAG